MARNTWNTVTLLVALLLSGSYFTWGQYPNSQVGSSQVGTGEPNAASTLDGTTPPLGFPSPSIPGNFVPQPPVSGAGTGPNFPQVAAAGSNELLMTTSLLSDGRQQVVITDTKTKTLAIYEVEPATGKVLLRSVREIKWDLQMQQFNATSPTPGEIRSMSGLK